MHSFQTNRIRIRPAVAAAGLALLASFPLLAGVTTYHDETAYKIELLRLGYTTVKEGFENATVWGAVRTPAKASSVTSKGITWTHNFPANPGHGITTGSGAAKAGSYGMFASPHGNFLNAPCTVPGICGDGFRGSTPPGTPMFAVGGWITTNTVPAQISIFLDDGPAVGLTDEVLSYNHKFFGVIDTAGFNEFEFREMEGTKEDAKFIFADVFTIGLTGADCGANSPPTAAFTVAPADPTASFTDASSDTDGTLVEWLWDFGDGNYSSQQNPDHTYASNGTYPVILYVRDNGNCTDASPPQTVLIASYPPADVAITNPTDGAIVSGTIGLTVSFTDPPSEIEQVTYFLDDVEYESSEETPFALSWDTTATPDGIHTLEARLTKFDETEIRSDPVTFTVSNAPPTPLETWRTQHFSAIDLADPTKEATVWGNEADPDRDGNGNWKEYVFGGDPLDPSDANLHVGVQVTAGGGGEVVLEMTYWQRRNDPALVFTHEVTSDLQTWHSGPAYTLLVSDIPVNAEIREVTFKDTMLGVGEGRHFGRVSVSAP